MNLRLLSFCIACCFAISHGLGSNAIGQVGLDHIRFSSPNELEVDQLAGNGFDMERAPAQLLFEHVSGNTFNYLGNDGAFGGNDFFGASVYLVESGDIFSEANLSSGMFPRLEQTVAYELPESFFIGIRTPVENVFTTPYPIAYGWASISNSDGQLMLNDHAVSYSGIAFNDPDRSGIVVGTFNQIGVPEPSSATLAFASSILLLLGRRKTYRS